MKLQELKQELSRMEPSEDLIMRTRVKMLSPAAQSVQARSAFSYATLRRAMPALLSLVLVCLISFSLGLGSMPQDVSDIAPQARSGNHSCVVLSNTDTTLDMNAARGQLFALSDPWDLHACVDAFLNTDVVFSAQQVLCAFMTPIEQTSTHVTFALSSADLMHEAANISYGEGAMFTFPREDIPTSISFSAGVEYYMYTYHDGNTWRCYAASSVEK